nr:PREDICTED: cytosolic carboxypeptidase 2 [Apteryx mantelli mantelli]
MQPCEHPAAQAVPEPYDSFMYRHLRYYGYFRGQKTGQQKSPMSTQEHGQGLSECQPAEAPSLGSAKPACSSPQGLGQELTPPQVLELALPKSKQLLSGRPPGCGSPLLREPRALFALPSARGPLPAPRWPVECEVIKEGIEHIEWVPPQPEPFYQPTGCEEAPAGGEECGTVVYHPIFSSVVIGSSCFTRARVGGAQGPLSSPAATLAGPHDTTLLFEARFESGNLQKAVKVGPHEYVLTLRPDLYTSKHTQWFYFRVQNTRKDPVYRFTIANLAKPKSLYSKGMKPLLYSQRDAQGRGIGWRRAGDDIRYYLGGFGEGQAAYCLTWTVRFPHDGDTCYFAHSYPYTYSDLQRYLQAVVGDPVRSQYCKVRALCRSLAGNTVYLLTISSPAGATAKRTVVLSARVHPGESGSSWVMRGFLDFILSDAPDAQLLRQLFIFKVVPMLNPDGVVVGNSRCSLAGRDLNRAYRTVLKDSFPCVWHTRAMVERVLAEREILLYCDFHGHSRKNNVFMYGCSGGGAGAAPRLHERVFPLMLSKNAPDKFSFRSCKFKVQKSKEGTGRIVMWRMGISNSYTMEAAFGGSTLGERLHSHFSVEDLKSLGYHICNTLLDFCHPNPAKVQQCLLELDALLQQKLHQKLGCKPGSGGSWSGISLSDLESSTSGSNSSESDGPPAHLLGLAEQVSLKQRKKKQLQTRRERNTLRQRYGISWDRPSRESISGSTPGSSLGPGTPASMEHGDAGSEAGIAQTAEATGSPHGPDERQRPRRGDEAGTWRCLRREIPSFLAWPEAALAEEGGMVGAGCQLIAAASRWPDNASSKNKTKALEEARSTGIGLGFTDAPENGPSNTGAHILAGTGREIPSFLAWPEAALAEEGGMVGAGCQLIAAASRWPDNASSKNKTKALEEARSTGIGLGFTDAPENGPSNTGAHILAGTG